MMRRRVVILALFSVLLFLGGQAAFATTATSYERLEDVLQKAYETNPSLRAARAELLAVQENMPQALSGWRPTVDASANVMDSSVEGSIFGGKGSTSKEMELGFNQPLYRGGRTIAAVGGADNIIHAQRAMLHAAEQNILLQTATAYMDVMRDKAVLELRESNEKVLTKEMQATKDRFDVGAVTRTDVSQAKARLARAQADKIRAMGDLQASRAAYEQVTGKPPGNLLAPLVRFPIPDTRDKALEYAQQNNPEVIAAEYMHRSAEKDVDKVFGEVLPQLALTGSWDRQYDPQPGLIDKTTTKTIGLTASIPLYQAGSVRSRVRQAKHTANQRYLEILESQRDIRKQVISNWESLKAARAEIDSRKAQVDAAKLAAEGMQQESKIGSRTVLDALDADQEYLDAQVALVTARRDVVVAEFRLASTLGLLNAKVLGLKDYTEAYNAHLNDINAKILGMDIGNDGVKP